MPELAAIYLVGLFACLVLTLLYIFLRAQRRSEDSYKRIQRNLHASGLYWSENEDKVLPYSQEREAADSEKLKRSTAILGGVLSLLSWAGFGFLLIVMISERFIARSRREKALFSSTLAREEMSPDRTRLTLQEIGLT